MTDFRIGVLVEKHDAQWALQCLEYDIAAQGRTFEDAKSAFSRAFMSKVARDLRAGKRPMEHIPTAPRCVVDAFLEGEDFGPGMVLDDYGLNVGDRQVRIEVTQFRITG